MRCRLSAETPSFCAANIQQAVNQTVSGVRRRSNRVPAVTDVLFPHPAHLYRPSAIAQPPACPQRGQTQLGPPCNRDTVATAARSLGFIAKPSPLEELKASPWFLSVNLSEAQELTIQ